MKTILAIDDDPAITTYLSRLLKKIGYNPIVANSCADGIAKASDPGVDAVIADILLPDSPKPREWIVRLHEAVKQKPILLISGAPDAQLEAFAVQNGVVALLSKPFELAFIKSLLNEIFTDTSKTDDHK